MEKRIYMSYSEQWHYDFVLIIYKKNEEYWYILDEKGFTKVLTFTEFTNRLMDNFIIEEEKLWGSNPILDKIIENV